MTNDPHIDVNTDDGSCILASDLDACASCSGETDGTGVIVDNDQDDDTYCDANDAFPFDASEWSDLDGDGYGDNIDACDNDPESYLDSDGDGVCDFREIEGCQDIIACNYNQFATDTGDCIYASDLDACATCSGETDGSGVIKDNDQDDDTYCDANDAFPFDASEWSDLDGDGYGDNIDACDNDPESYLDSDGDGVCDFREIVGCQDSIACNYNSLATDSSICYIPVGCDSCLDTLGIESQIDSLNLLVQGYESQISDLELQVSSLTNSSGSDVDVSDLEAELDSLEGLMPSLEEAFNSVPVTMQSIVQDQIDNLNIQISNLQDEIDSLSQSSSSSEIDELNQQISNFESNIQTENQNISDLQAQLDAGYIVDNDSDNDGVCDADEIVGCQDPSACNYDASATDSGVCNIPVGCDSCDDNGEIVDNDSDDDGYCNLGSGIAPEEIIGCQDPTACNYMELATDADDCVLASGCESCSGETDGSGVTVNNDSDDDGYCDLGSGISPEEILGCTQDWADNYSEEATEEDSSCYRNGCMYPAMANYDPLATQDPNLSCNFNQDTLDFEVDLVSDSLNAIHSAEIDSLNTEIDSLNTEIVILNAVHNSQVDSLSQVISDLEDQVDGLEVELQIANSVIDSLYNLIDSLNTVYISQVDSLEQLISNLEDEVEVLEEALESAESQVLVLVSDTMQLNSTINDLNAAAEIDSLLIDSLITANLNLSDELDSCRIESENCVSDPIMVDLASGWNMIGFTLYEEQDVVASFDGISDKLEIVKDNYGDVYLVEWDYNGIGNLIPGQGYQLKLSEAVSGFTFPTTDLRINLTPSVPQWALDMEVELHPNDIRTLVRVVNELGQEVDPNLTPNGSVLFYIYNDATVEKRVNSKF